MDVAQLARGKGFALPFQIGHLTGAKVLVTGRVFNVGRETMIVAKIIGTETSRVYGEVVRADTGQSVADCASSNSCARRTFARAGKQFPIFT